MSGAINFPFYTQVPAGIALPSSGSGQSGTSSTASATSASSAGAGSTSTKAASNSVDTVSIRPILSGGTFTAEQGDTFSLSTLVQGTAAKGSAISNYEVALPANSGGKLSLHGQDVTNQGTFTADQFAYLQYIAGNIDTAQNILVVAQSSNGGLVDSPAVQLTADVTGTRSLNALPALLTQPDAQDQQYVALAQEASIYTGTGTNQPSLSTVGNFTAEQGDTFNLATLMQGTAAPGASISRYEVALAANSGGTLTLDGQDVTTQTDFTAAQFADLQYVAGSTGSTQNILVVAQSNQNGSVDSRATQITASVTGTRSLNALPALRTEPDAQDQQFTALAQEASIYTGTGTNRPSLSTLGDFTAQQGDAYNLWTLVHGTAAQGSSISTYEVALAANSGGTLMLDGVDVTSQGSFTAAQFADLQYIAGSTGTSQNILVVAQTAAHGSLVDSPAVQITASVTGTRSLNALPALETQPDAQDQQYVALAQETSIYTGTGTNRPSLSTIGNFTAEQGDVFNLSTLVQGTAASGTTISDYEVALGAGSGGTLLLNGEDVTNQGTFTAAQFADLQYIAGSTGTAENILVAAQTTKNGSVDSPAVQITASVTGARSLNALPALLTQPDAQDEAFTTLAQEASIFTGTSTNRPSLSTLGNFTAQAGDAFNLSTLVQGKAASGTTIKDYEVALAANSGGTLMLNGEDVTNQGTFTAAEFADLQYIAGSSGTTQNILVAAQTNKGGLVDSPAVQITASVTGTRSLNALPALQTQPDTQDQAYITLAQEASIYTGTGTNRPTVKTILGTDPSQQPDPTAVGAFQQTASSSVASGTYNATAFDPSGVGGFEQTGTLAAAALSLYELLFPQQGDGGSTTVGNANLQTVAINAYLAAHSL